jgi:hypothetical protein
VARSSTSFAKGNAHRFKHGNNANPAGRPKLADDLHALARQHTRECIERLLGFMRQQSDLDLALAATTALLDRGWGKPATMVLAQVQTQVVTGGIDAPPRESLPQWIERRRRELAALDGAQVEHQQQQPNGETAADDAHSVRSASAAPQSAPVAERPGAAPGTAPPRKRELTPDERQWLRDQRHRLGIESDGDPD